MQNFRALGAPPPDPRASGSWGQSPQTPKSAPPLRISGYASAIWYYILPDLGIYSCWQPIFRLIIQTLTLHGESAEISLGGMLNLDGDANSRWWDASSLQFRFRVPQTMSKCLSIKSLLI